MKKAGSEEPAKLGMKDLVFLDRDVAVRAVDDAAGIKLPTVVCHALDCRLVFAGEGYARKADATIERLIPNARHTVGYRHTCQSAAIDKRIFSDARHTVGYRHRRQSAATTKRLISDARHIGSDFNYLRFFYPNIVMTIK